MINVETAILTAAQFKLYMENTLQLGLRKLTIN